MGFGFSPLFFRLGWTNKAMREALVRPRVTDSRIGGIDDVESPVCPDRRAAGTCRFCSLSVGIECVRACRHR